MREAVLLCNIESGFNVLTDKAQTIADKYVGCQKATSELFSEWYA